MAAGEATNGSAKPATASTDGAAAAAKKSYNVEIAKQPGAHGRPDKAANDAEMDKLKKQIDKVQAEVVSTIRAGR